MSLNTKQHFAIIALYPQVVTVRGDVAYEKDAKEVVYDLNAVNVKAAEMQAEEEDIRVKFDAKQAALKKLMALGLTEEEALALGK